MTDQQTKKLLQLLQESRSREIGLSTALASVQADLAVLTETSLDILTQLGCDRKKVHKGMRTLRKERFDQAIQGLKQAQ